VTRGVAGKGLKEQIKVLLVEDVETDADLALRELKRAGIRCVGVRVDTESEFRRELTQFQPHVILSDFSMPHFDGMDALVIAREMSPDTPFIFISGTIGEEYAIGALRNGAFDYVLKNNLLRLPPAVERAVQDAKARSAKRRAEQLRALEHLVNRRLAEADSASSTLREAIRAVCEAERWECGRYFHFDDKAGVLRFSESWGVPGAAVERFISGSRELTHAPGVGLVGRVFVSGEPLWIADIGKDARVTRATLASESGIRGAFVFPIKSAGNTIGVLAFNSREIREPEEPLLQAIGVIGAQIGQFLQRKLAEEELRRFRIAMDNSADIIVLIDRATMRFVDVNNTACKLLGYSRKELLEMGPQDVLPVSRDELERSYDELIANPSVTGSLKTDYRRKDGTLLPFESTRRVLRSGDEWSIVAISRDIGERIGAEEALRKSNERFNLAVRATNDVIWDWDIATDELWWNDNLTKAFGYRRDDLDRTRKSWYDLIHPEDRDRVVNDLHRLLELGGESWSDKYRLRRADGSYAFIFDRGHVIRDASDKAVRMIGAKADVTARKEAEERLSYMAQFDTLTGLPNRHLFRDRLAQTLAQAQRNNQLVGVMYLDLDRFKVINDTFGHAAGDALLVQVAEGVNQALRSGDSAGRISGDEFAVVLSNLAKADDAALVAKKVLMALARPFDLEGIQTYTSASIGIAIYPDDGGDADGLLKNAGTAMHRVKEKGRNNYQFYLPEMNERAVRRLQLESGLRGALERKEFLLHYQPKVELASGVISGFEALLRWQHPERGLVSPAQFIPILEDTGLMVPVGEWVMLTVCEQIKAWQSQGIKPRPVAINLSGRQFQQKNLEATVARLIQETGIDPALLELELTESILMSDAEEAVRTLKNLTASGVRLTVDDFGTGYSSLAYLKRFPLDALKIDHAFIRDATSDPDDAAIAIAIINLAHSLKIKVVAEGVETAAQLNFLRAHGCDEMQGFYFARPLSVADCTQTLIEDRRLEN
jgi:diguanylate cyclase (GGDEF)-like protein/PAS domain S-box-containing protein